jgi:hypothetical protein
MNKELLMLTYSNLMNWLMKCSQETVSTDKKLEIVMMALADMCQALAAETADEARAIEDRAFGREP